MSENLGFSVGDELGLPESIGNLEGNKRRSLSDRDSIAAANSIGTLPASKLPVRMKTKKMFEVFELAPQIHHRKLFVLRSSFQPYQSQPIQQNRPIAVLPGMPQQFGSNHNYNQQQSTVTTTSTNYKQSVAVAMTPEPAVPVFKRIPTTTPQVTAAQDAPIRPIYNAAAQNTFQRKVMAPQFSAAAAAVYPSNVMSQLNNLTFTPGQPFRASNAIQKIQTKPQSQLSAVPAFQAMPSSVSRISSGQVVQLDTKTTVKTVKREVCAHCICNDTPLPVNIRKLNWFDLYHTGLPNATATDETTRSRSARSQRRGIGPRCERKRGNHSECDSSATTAIAVAAAISNVPAADGRCY